MATDRLNYASSNADEEFALHEDTPVVRVMMKRAGPTGVKL